MGCIQKGPGSALEEIRTTYLTGYLSFYLPEIQQVPTVRELVSGYHIDFFLFSLKRVYCHVKEFLLNN
jgi:hypothetical protein